MWIASGAAEGASGDGGGAVRLIVGAALCANVRAIIAGAHGRMRLLFCRHLLADPGGTFEHLDQVLAQLSVLDADERRA
jgi:hypothetical protein